MTPPLDRQVRRIAGGVAAGFALGALPVVVLDRAPRLQARSVPAAVLACGIPYLPLAVAGTSAALSVACRSRAGRVLAAGVFGGALAAAARAWLPDLVPPTSEVTAPDLTVVSANVLYGLADPGRIASLAQTADVVAVQENTPAFHASLEALIGVDFPYREGTSRGGAAGTMTWSRTPLTLLGTGRTVFSSVAVSTTVRGVDWVVANVHPVSPLRGIDAWESDARSVLDLVRPHLAQRLVVVGDFNAIEEHATMRRLADAGLRNAMAGTRRRAGDGWQPSWPTDKTWLPPVIRIDHALHSASVEASRPEYVVVPGSDHKALVATFEARGLPIRERLA